MIVINLQDITSQIDRKVTLQEQSIEVTRKALQEAALEGQLRDLGATVAALTVDEGKLKVWATAKQVVSWHQANSDLGEAGVLARLIEVGVDKLTNGADDGWSGRGNDLKRSEFDGIRQAASELILLATL